jgi:hypothetical protein
MPTEAARLLALAMEAGADRTAAGRVNNFEGIAISLESEFPIGQEDAHCVCQSFDEPEPLARELVRRFSPKWLLGWRDITNVTNERTLIASVLPRVAVGHTFPLAFCPGIHPATMCGLLAAFNCFVLDYAVRQKVGGTHITYNLLKQFPCPSPSLLEAQAAFANQDSWLAWLASRVLELVHTANDTEAFANDVGYAGPPFVWDEARRFDLRCEIDAAFFHLYLAAKGDRSWQPVDDEAPAQLDGLVRYFARPKDAISHILDQFPIIRDKDQKKFGCYRTKIRILEIYDAMLDAQRTEQPYVSRLDPPPGIPQSIVARSAFPVGQGL